MKYRRNYFNFFSCVTKKRLFKNGFISLHFFVFFTLNRVSEGTEYFSCSNNQYEELKQNEPEKSENQLEDFKKKFEGCHRISKEDSIKRCTSK